MAKSLLGILPSWVRPILTDEEILREGIKFFRKKNQRTRELTFNSFRNWGRVAWVEDRNTMLPYHRISSREPWKIVLNAISPEVFLESEQTKSAVPITISPYTTPLEIV